MISGTLLGQATLSTVPDAVSATGFVVEVGGVDEVGKLLDGGFRMRQNLRAGGEARLDFREVALPSATTFHPLIGQEVRVFDQGELIFAGSIEKVSESTESQSGTGNKISNVVRVDAVDWTARLDDVLVADKYEDKSQGEIVKEIVTETVLSTDGITTVNVEDGVTIDEMTVDYRKASGVLDDLVKLTDWTWFVDYFKNLWFTDKSTVPAPTNYTTANRGFRSLTYTRDRSGYANRLVLRAGKAKTDSRTEKFFGDGTPGENRSFELAFEVSDQKPIIVAAGSTVTPADIGIRGEDKEEDAAGNPTNFKWFYKPREKAITQSSKETPLTDAQKLEVTYVGLFDIILDQQNADEITRRSEIEGGSGEYQIVEDEKSIDGRQNAIDRATGILSTVDEIPGEVSIETDDTGWCAGQVMSLDLPEHGLSGPFIIEQVRRELVRGTSSLIRSRLRLKNVGRMSRHYDFWRQIEEQGYEFLLREGQELQLIRKASEFVTYTDTPGVAIGNSLSSASSDVHSWFAIGSAVVGASSIRQVDSP